MDLLAVIRANENAFKILWKHLIDTKRQVLTFVDEKFFDLLAR